MIIFMIDSMDRF